MIKEIR